MQRRELELSAQTAEDERQADLELVVRLAGGEKRSPRARLKIGGRYRMAALPVVKSAGSGGASFSVRGSTDVEER
jgi:hypothetical protein